jgi:hypothetical protein
LQPAASFQRFSQRRPLHLARTSPGLVLLLLIATLGITTPAQTQIPANHDRLKALKSIAIEAGETASDVQCFLCNVHVRGHVTGDVVTFGGSIFVDGRVDGDAVAFGGRIESHSNSKIFGDAVAIGGYVSRQDNSVIVGDSKSMPYVLIPGQYRPTVLGSLTLAFINMLFVALGYLFVREKRAETFARAIERRPTSVFFAGIFLLLIFYGLDWLTGYLGRMETVSDIVLLALFLAVAAAGATGLGYWVARVVFPETNGVWAAIGGVLALSLLELVPLLGLLVFAVGLTISVGASLATRFGSREVSVPKQAAQELEPQPPRYL